MHYIPYNVVLQVPTAILLHKCTGRSVSFFIIRLFNADILLHVNTNQQKRSEVVGSVLDFHRIQKRRKKRAENKTTDGNGLVL